MVDGVGNYSDIAEIFPDADPPFQQAQIMAWWYDPNNLGVYWWRNYLSFRKFL
jgi:hypothetical protein